MTQALLVGINTISTPTPGKQVNIHRLSGPIHLFGNSIEDLYPRLLGSLAERLGKYLESYFPRYENCSGYCEFPLLRMTKEKTLTLIGLLINGTSEEFWGMRELTKEG